MLPGGIRSASMHAGCGAVTQSWPLPACTWSITLSDTLNDERSCHCHIQSLSGLRRLLRQFSCFLLLVRGGQPWPARYRAGASQPLACLFARHQSACTTLYGFAGRSRAVRVLQPVCPAPLAMSRGAGGRCPMPQSPAQTWPAGAARSGTPPRLKPAAGSGMWRASASLAR